jgi:hypothetical protein
MYEMPANQKDGYCGLVAAYTMAASPCRMHQGTAEAMGLHGLQFDVMAPTGLVGFAPVEVRLNLDQTPWPTQFSGRTLADAAT